MKAINGKILIRIDMLQKEKYNMGDGNILYWARSYNFNLREDRATMGYVVDGNGMKEGVPVLVHYLSTEPTYSVDHENILTEKEKRDGFKVRNVDVGMVFCWFDGENWQPCKDFLITKRIFKEYKGPLVGIEHQKVKNRLYVVNGLDEYDGEVNDLSGNVCIVTENSDAELIWHNEQNREERLIRTMHREIEAIDGNMTNDLKKGKYLIGNSSNDCKQLNI